jgi:transposase
MEGTRMPTERLSMRRIRQVLQLHFGARASARVIAGTVGIGRSTVQDYLARAATAELAWPLPAELTDEALEQLLFPAPSNRPGVRRYVEPDWAALVREMKRPGVNLSVLFEEYREVQPDGYAYSRFCELYRAFERRLSPTMRQHHVAGDKAFVDYSGKRVPIVDSLTGEMRMAELFIAVLGASNFTYADASWTQSLPDWIGAHVRMFRFFGSATADPGQSQERHQQALILRPRNKSQLRQNGSALQRRRGAGTAAKAEGQSCRGGRRPLCAVLYCWSPAQRDLLFPG